MKTLDDAVIELNGVLPSCLKNKFNTENGWYLSTKGKLTHSESCVWFDLRQFQQRAKELGFVGKYRWGVEYKADGKRPDLPDDVTVSYKNKYHGNLWIDEGAEVKDLCFEKESGAYPVTSFKITGLRYKPVDTSYLDKPSNSLNNESEWFDYDNQKALRLPPVGVEVIGFIGTGFKMFNLFYVGKNSRGSLVGEDCGGEFRCFHDYQINFKPLDHDRKAKAKAEKGRVVDAAIGCCDKDEYEGFDDLFSHLYDKGFLRLPE